MPFFKSKNALIYYAHVPKCGGSSVAFYIQERFGALAFHENQFESLGAARQWTKSSPQHVDRGTLERLIPLEFFDGMFSIVRHPVPRLISTFHFQQEVEKTIPDNMGFSDWLSQLDPQNSHFQYDNHILPMNQIVPEGATVFHLEHGLDSMIVWLDQITGNQNGPRAFEEVNRRGAYTKSSPASSQKVDPTPDDLARIAKIYAEDFARFGYDVQERQPEAAAPEITPEFIAARDAEVRRMNGAFSRLKRKIRRRINKSLNS